MQKGGVKNWGTRIIEAASSTYSNHATKPSLPVWVTLLPRYFAFPPTPRLLTVAQTRSLPTYNLVAFSRRQGSGPVDLRDLGRGLEVGGFTDWRERNRLGGRIRIRIRRAKGILFGRGGRGDR